MSVPSSDSCFRNQLWSASTFRKWILFSWGLLCWQYCYLSLQQRLLFVGRLQDVVLGQWELEQHFAILPWWDVPYMWLHGLAILHLVLGGISLWNCEGWPKPQKSHSKICIFLKHHAKDYVKPKLILASFSVSPLVCPAPYNKPALHSHPLSFQVHLALESLHSLLLTCAFPCASACCQHPILSDQVLLDIPHLEVVMFNIKFTYLNVVDAAQDFWFSREIQNTLCSTIEIYSSYT